MPNTTSPKDITRRCVDCRSLAACRYAFGKYFTDKSRGGYGCRVPFDPPPEYLASIQLHLTKGAGNDR